MKTDTVLETANLVKRFGSFTAVNDISFSIKKGEVVGFLGPNGAGKSTTIQMLLGLLTPTSGTIKYFGKDFHQNRLATLSRINYLSAFNTLQGRITVEQNLRVFADAYGVKNPTQKINELLEYFAVPQLKKVAYDNISAGQRTRVNLAKAFLNDPELVLMDEPTASLDPDIVDRVLTMIEDLKKRRELTILYTSHNMPEVERICDRVVFLAHGNIVHEAKTKDLPSLHQLFIKIARDEPES
ncbi:MAG TPA: ABC transporter ATP-binding protein [Candidatus Saccharimonadales bacterium]|nr:ABC transporter ATP-binding protein [Candidatus Saccharimonadales bacterium]